MAALNLSRLAARVVRARSAVHKGITYHLGTGGNNPNSPLPDDGHGTCDCSGFALSWCMGISRDQSDKYKPWSARLGWINTDAAIHDAHNAHDVYIAIERPVAGCAVVYGKSATEDYGHCAIVTDSKWNPSGRLVSLRGIDCAHGPSAATGEAINERDLTTVFLPHNPVFLVMREDYC